MSGPIHWMPLPAPFTAVTSISTTRSGCARPLMRHPSAEARRILRDHCEQHAEIPDGVICGRIGIALGPLRLTEHGRQALAVLVRPPPMAVAYPSLGIVGVLLPSLCRRYAPQRRGRPAARRRAGRAVPRDRRTPRGVPRDSAWRSRRCSSGIRRPSWLLCIAGSRAGAGRRPMSRAMLWPRPRTRRRRSRGRAWRRKLSRPSVDGSSSPGRRPPVEVFRLPPPPISRRGRIVHR